MLKQRPVAWRSIASLLIVFVSYSAQAQAPGQATAQNVAEMKFSQFPGMPECATGSVQSGDPAKGPSIIFAKSTPGCSFPWHWHTSNEHLMMVSGVARAEMKDGKPMTLRPGAFAMMPSKHVHRFSCTKACTLYVYSDAAFDIHYVDDQGKEIPSEEALRKVKQPRPRK